MNIIKTIKKKIHKYKFNKIFNKKNLIKFENFYSDSKKYKLRVNHYKTTKNGWNYTKGIVYNNKTGKIIAEVKRNYCSFDYLFVENHTNGHDYLICGENYQGQTVVELDTGEIKNYLPKEAEKGFGFCWANFKFDRESCILIVDGCYWGGPYKYKFFNFSNPMWGWPELKLKDENLKDTYVLTDKKWPEIKDDEITCYSIFYDETNEDDQGDDDIEFDENKHPFGSIRTFKRDYNELILKDEWISEKEQEERIRREKGLKRSEEYNRNFEQNNTLYLRFSELIKDKKFSPENYSSFGITYVDWFPNRNLNEKRYCKRIITKGKYTVDFEMAMESGIIKLVIYKNGNFLENKFYASGNIDDVERSLEYVKSLL